MSTATVNTADRLNVDRPVAAWVWNVFQHLVNPEDLFRFCRDNGVTHLYLYLRNELTTLSMSRFLKQCVENGIAPIALLGDPDWVLSAGHSKYEQRMEQLQELQKTCEEGCGFTAVHFDIAPYVMRSVMLQLEDNQMVERLLGLMYDARERVHALGLPLEWDVPVWFAEHEDTAHGCSLAETLIRECDGVTIMAYRNSLARSKQYLLQPIAWGKQYQKPLLFGFETVDSYEARAENGHSRLTYYGLGKRHMYRAIAQTEAFLIEHELENFGFAIHDISRWMLLSEETLPEYMEDLKDEI